MNFANIQLLGAGRVAADPRWKMPPHLHPFHELIVLVQGKMEVKSGGQTIEASTGDVLLYPAQVLHAETSDAAAPVETLFLSFRRPMLPLKAVARTQDRSGRIRQMIRWLYEDRHASAADIQEQRRLLLQAIVAEFFRNLRWREHPLLVATRQYVRDHLAEALSLECLARQAQLSKYHFLRSYKAVSGRTPMTDVRIIRAHAARELILGTNLPLKDIAPRVGLGNEYAMSRIFRRYFNLPPGEWRRRR